MDNATPAASDDARRGGLALGTPVRSKRATLKRLMAAGDVDPFDVIAGRVPDWEDTAANTPIEALLLAVPGVGPVTVDKVLDERRIPPSARLYALTDERREEIATELRKRVAP